MKRKASKMYEAELIEQATQGDLSAQIYLGYAYGKYGDFGHDASQAEYWARRASETGSLKGLRGFARFLYDHNRDEVQVVIVQLLNRRDFYGHFLMGHILIDGSCGLPADRSAALAHLKIAADMGHIPSAISAVKLEYKYPLLKGVARKKLFRLVRDLVRARFKDPNSLAIFR